MCQHVPPSEKKNFFEEIKGIDTAIHSEIFLKFPSGGTGLKWNGPI